MRNAYPIDAKKLRRVMKYREMTITKLARESDVYIDTISRILNRKVKYPKLETLGSLAIALQVPWRMLVKEE